MGVDRIILISVVQMESKAYAHLLLKMEFASIHQKHGGSNIIN